MAGLPRRGALRQEIPQQGFGKRRRCVLQHQQQAAERQAAAQQAVKVREASGNQGLAVGSRPREAGEV